jgi:hypothetical protein
MNITIEYESSWRNSFLDGSNNEPLPKTGRKYIGSMTNLKSSKNFIQRQVTFDTVMGVLNRLIGDQSKLYQARKRDDYFFRDMEAIIGYEDKPTVINSEMTYIRNITGSTDQNSYTGMVKTSDPTFTSAYSHELWGVLALDFDELCIFISKDCPITAIIDLDPLAIIARLEELNKVKAVSINESIKNALDTLHQSFSDINYLNKKEEVVPISIYCSGLYLQLKRLEKRFKKLLDSAKTKAGGISGISKRGFTKKDFMSRFTTGEKKKIWGNPYIREEFIKGGGKVKHLMTKASGSLEIVVDVERDKAKEIKSMIDNAGVSSFYLGKKGLAYVTDVDTREVRR